MARRRIEPIRKIPAAFVWALAAVLVAACGGGGGGGGPADDPTPTPPVDGPTPAPPAEEMPPESDPSPEPNPPVEEMPPEPDPPVEEMPLEPDPLPEPCLATQEGCLAESAYLERVGQIASGYRNDEYFRAPDPENENDPARGQWELGLINADEGYAHLDLAEGVSGKPGSGVTVGLLDTGIDVNHPAFRDKKVEEVFLENFMGTTAQDEPADCTDQQIMTTDRCDSHGTYVAGFLAADRTGIPVNPHGVAWGADLTMFAVPTGDGSRPFSPIAPSVLDILDDVDAAKFQRIVDWRDGARSIDFVNVSIGYDGPVSLYDAATFRINYGATIAALAQADRNREDRTVFVFAAGNSHNKPCGGQLSIWCQNGSVVADSPDIWGGLPAWLPELRGVVLSAVAVNRNGDIAGFSNRCGIAGDWCLAAPGVDLRAIYPGRGNWTLRRLQGTSFAAPIVTGSLAVLKHRFRDSLSNVDLAERLLATADKTGKYADSDVYGQGLLDLGAALSPVGELGFSVGGRVGRGVHTVGHTRLRTGPAMGDGLARSLAGREVAAFDELGAPFWTGLSNFVSSPGAPLVGARLRAFMALEAPARPVDEIPSFEPHRFQLGFPNMPRGAERGHLSFARRAPGFSLTDRRSGFSATAFSTAGIAGRTSASGVALSWRPQAARIGVRTGLLAEHETLLGTSGKGAFGDLRAGSAFVGIEGDVAAAGWLLSGHAELGMAAPELDGGMVRYMSPLATSAFSVQATRWLTRDDALRLSVSQPLRVESGRAMLLLPVGRTRGGEVLQEAVRSGLAPSGRQVDLAAHWFRSSAMGSELRLGASWSRHPNHRADEDSALTLLAGWRYAF